MQWSAVPAAECAVDPTLLPNLGRAERNVLGRVWLDDARLKHSAVSAFLTLAAELAALCAPSSLVRRAIHAIRDEANHTRLCLEGASRLTGLRWTLPPFRPPEPPRRSIRSLVCESWEDGCLGEGIAARAAREGARHCRHAWTRRALETIARDEARHADLAWRILEWCLALPGADGEEARDALAARVGRTNRGSTSRRDLLPTRTSIVHGRISAEQALEIAEQEFVGSERLARSMLVKPPARVARL